VNLTPFKAEGPFLRREGFLFLLLFLTVLSASLSYLLVLPPYEGFDENRHYSYISYLATTGRVPDFRHTPLDASVEELQQLVPVPYHPAPPFLPVRGKTYAQFFKELTPDNMEMVYRKLWSNRNYPGYQPGKEINAQGQHPPLYYLSMIGPYLLSRDWPSGYRLIFLRFFSVLWVWIGFGVWIKALRLLDSRDTRVTLVLGAASLLFFPSFFFDLARLGNDSLASLLASLCFYFMVRIGQKEGNNIKNHGYLAICLGLGCLTKLFFVPIVLGVMAYSGWVAYKHKTPLKGIALRLGILGFFALLISLPWFLLFYQRYGMLLGSIEFHRFKGQSALAMSSSPVLEFTREFLRGWAGFTRSFLWSGSWSWIQVPYWHYLSFVPLFFLLIRNFFLSIKKVGQEIELLTIGAFLVLGSLLAGFFYHMVTCLVLTLVGSGSSGYYLFIYWAFLSVFFQYAFYSPQGQFPRYGVPLIFLPLLLFEASGWWRELLVFGGILVKTSKVGSGYIPPTGDQISAVLSRLSLLSFAGSGSLLFVFSLVLKMILPVYALTLISDPRNRGSVQRLSSERPGTDG